MTEEDIFAAIAASMPLLARRLGRVEASTVAVLDLGPLVEPPSDDPFRPRGNYRNFIFTRWLDDLDAYEVQASAALSPLDMPLDVIAPADVPDLPDWLPPLYAERYRRHRGIAAFIGEYGLQTP